MARVDPSPELFKLYSDEDQSAVLNKKSLEINDLQKQADQLSADIDRRQHNLDMKYDSMNRSGYTVKDGELTEESTFLERVGSGIMDGYAEQRGGENVYALNDIGVTGMVIYDDSKITEEKESLQAINSELGQKQASYNTLSSAVGAPQDQDALDSELTNLYKSQLDLRDEFLANDAAIQRKENAINQLNKILWSSTSKLEKEKKALENRQNEILAAYNANSEMLMKAAEFLTEDELKRFIELDKYMSKKAGKPVGSQTIPPPPPPPPKPAPSVPIVQRFVTAGARLQCSFGAACTLNVNRPMTLLENAPMANIMDFAPFTCIVPTGTCSAPSNPAVVAAMGSPVPCTPLIVAPWAVGKPDVLVENFPALLSTDKCFCAYGGVISIMP
jgi:hypothetical protein